MKREGGVTLIEMLVVMTLVGLLAAVVAPSVGSGLETVRLRATGEKLAATLRMARTRALRTQHYMQVSVDPQLRVVELRDLEGGSLSSWEIPNTIQVLSERRLAYLVYPDGGTQMMRVDLRNQKGRQVEVASDPFTMFPTVKEMPREVSQ
jgi:type II secretion system protein H